GICTLCTDHAEVALARAVVRGRSGMGKVRSEKWKVESKQWKVMATELTTYHLSLAQALDIKGKRVLVVGLGKSGVASAIFLKDRGARVSVSDAKTEDQLRSAIPALLDKGISVETGGHGERAFRDQDLIVVSPGVPSDVPQLQKARAQ